MAQPLVLDRAPAVSGPVAALRDTYVIGLGMIPLGMAFGLLVVQSGLAWWWTPIISVTVYAGSLEFLLVGLLMAITPLPQLALTAFLVNSRHVFYGLGFPLHRVRGKIARIYSMYALTDETYALTAGRPPATFSSARILWTQAFLQSYWVLGGILGGLLSFWLPRDIAGLQFTLTALFVVLAIDAFRVTRDLCPPALALGCALLALWLAAGEALVVAMTLYVACLLGRYLLGRRREPARA